MAGTDTANLVYRWATVSIMAATMVVMLYRIFAGTVRRAAERGRALSRAKPVTPAAPSTARMTAAIGSQPASGPSQD